MHITPLEFQTKFFLFLPVDLSNSVAEGDELLVELASFLSQQFGLIRGRVTSISSAGLQRQLSAQSVQGLFAMTCSPEM